MRSSNASRWQMPAVERLGVDAVQMAHATRQARFRCLDEQVALVGHQAVGAANPAEALDRVGERVEEEVAIRIDEEDVLPRVAGARDVEPRRSRSRQVKPRNRRRLPSCFLVKQSSIAQGARHGASLVNRTCQFKI